MATRMVLRRKQVAKAQTAWFGRQHHAGVAEERSTITKVPNAEGAIPPTVPAGHVSAGVEAGSTGCGGANAR